MSCKQDPPTKPLLTRPDHDRKFYGANLAEVFRTPLYDCSLKNVCGVPDFALTRLKGGSMEMQQEPAYLGNKADLTKFRDMLVTSHYRVEKLKSAGKSAQEAVAEKPFADLDPLWAMASSTASSGSESSI